MRLPLALTSVLLALSTAPLAAQTVHTSPVELVDSMPATPGLIISKAVLTPPVARGVAVRPCGRIGELYAYAAMRAAERDPGVFRCAVSYAGVSDLRAMVRYDSRFLYSGVRNDWMRKQAPDLAAVPPINAVARFSTPLLMIHGTKDRVVPVKQSRGLAQKLKAAGKPATYIEQPEADHHFSRAEYRLQFLQALDEFLRTHNPV